jgi:hypothetical protein
VCGANDNTKMAVLCMRHARTRWCMCFFYWLSSALKRPSTTQISRNAVE